jgi:very-short-patch-repair endonuclease
MVGDALISRGYNIEPQHAVGSYRIDIVIRNTNVAIECDGEAFHSGDERVRKDMERQTILERLGWQFIRIRGSDYFRHEEECINDVVSQLEEIGAPVHVSSSDNNENRSTPLLEKVKIRANQILEEWHEGSETTIKADTMFTTPVINQGNTNTRLKVTANPIQRYDTTKDDWPKVETKDIKPVGNSAQNPKNIRTRKNTDSRRYKKSVFKEELINELGKIGQVVNKSSENGTIWLYGPKCLAGLVNKIAQKYGVNCSFEARGGMQIKGKPAWVITRK